MSRVKERPLALEIVAVLFVVSALSEVITSFMLNFLSVGFAALGTGQTVRWIATGYLVLGAAEFVAAYRIWHQKSYAFVFGAALAVIGAVLSIYGFDTDYGATLALNLGVLAVLMVWRKYLP